MRLFKASLGSSGGSEAAGRSPEERSNSSDAVTVRENHDTKTSTDISPLVADEPRCASSGGGTVTGGLMTTHLCEKLGAGASGTSLTDSGHFDDMSSACSLVHGGNGSSTTNQNLEVSETEFTQVIELISHPRCQLLLNREVKPLLVYSAVDLIRFFSMQVKIIIITEVIWLGVALGFTWLQRKLSHSII